MQLLANLFKAATAKGYQSLAPLDYKQRFMTGKERHLLVDVRSPEEFKSGTIAGAKNIPLQSLEQRLNEFPHDRPIVLFCRSGNRSGMAADLLAQKGYSDLYNLGGVMQWTAQGLPVR